MNLFLLGWNLPPTTGHRAHEALRSLAPIYPQLDPGTTWLREAVPGTFAVSMHTPTAAIGRRRYRHETPGEVVLYDGSLIDRCGEFAALDARQLARHWDALEERLEGHFVIARLGSDPPRLELLNDALGLTQVYHRQVGEGWVVANSVTLIERLLGRTALDPLGASLMVGLGWTGADRTLCQDVHVVPAAQHWCWRVEAGAPTRRTYFERSSLARQPQRRLRPAAVDTLVDRQRRNCATFARDYGDCWCSLTGGRDSRVLAALFLGSGLPLRYYTSGQPGSADVEYARAIAELLELQHEIRPRQADQIIARWEIAAARLVTQNDGLISLMQIADVLEQPEEVTQLGFAFWGIGGEVSRAPLTTPRIAVLGSDALSARMHLRDMSLGPGAALLRAEGLELVHRALDRFVDLALADGFAPRDIPHLFFVDDRTRRWAGSNARKAMPTGDRFSPFCTRDWVRTAFAQPVGYRHAEWLHATVIRRASRALFALPITGHRWRSRSPMVNGARWLVGGALHRVRARLGGGDRRPHGGREGIDGGRRVSRSAGDMPLTYDRVAWLVEQRDWLRRTCLDRPQSAVWQLVDRRLFERATAPGAETELRRLARSLYHVATVFAAVED
ncbi:MAG: hypothetical protein PVF43_03015 [Candidatus Eiseniibacteriota bacterium]|jgi:asparagine synthase (glutamine-hydrolysing)